MSAVIIQALLSGRGLFQTDYNALASTLRVVEEVFSDTGLPPDFQSAMLATHDRSVEDLVGEEELRGYHAVQEQGWMDQWTEAECAIALASFVTDAGPNLKDRDEALVRVAQWAADAVEGLLEDMEQAEDEAVRKAESSPCNVGRGGW